MKIQKLQHEWPEKAGFCIDRPYGREDYTVLVFYNKVALLTGGAIETANAGGCIIYEPGVPQWFQSIGPLTHDWMHLSADAAEDFAAMDLPMNTVFYPRDTATIHRLFWEMESEFMGDLPFREELLSQKYRQLLIALYRDRHLPPSEPPAKEELVRLRQMRHQILLHPEKDWSVPQMAALADMCVSRFYAAYKAAFGDSPMETCIRARINAAENQLGMTDLSVKEIALSLGYRNLCHFHRQFKEYTGQTPLACRAHWKESGQK